jgi:hypothetical protein
VCLLVAAPASAEELVLEWDAPPGCPSAGDVHAQVAQLLRRTPETRLSARADVRSDATGWHVVLETTVGERRLDAPSCDEIARAVALVLALAIDREAITPETAGGGARALPAPAPALRPASRRTPLRGGLGVAAAADVGTLPAPAAGVSVAVGLRPDRWRLEVTATYWAPQSAALGGTANVGGDFRLLGGGASVCRAALRWPLEVAACARAEGGILSGTGTGVSTPKTAQSPFWTVLAGVTAALPFGRRAALRIDADLGWNPLRPTFALEPYGTVHQPAVIVGRARLGAEVLFP